MLPNPPVPARRVRRSLFHAVALLVVGASLAAVAPTPAPTPAAAHAQAGRVDACPYGYAPAHTVFFGRHAASGVPNREVGAGCTVMDLIMAGRPFPLQVGFVAHVVSQAALAVLTGALTPGEQARVIAAAIGSDIGRHWSATAASPVELTRTGVVLYTVRDTMSADPRGTLGALAACGIPLVEPSGRVDDLYGRDPAALSALIEDAGLAAPSVGVTLDDLRARMTEVAAAADAFGARYVRISGSDTWTHDDYAEVAGELNALGADLGGHDLTLAYHNHAWELEEGPGGVRGLDVLARQTDPALVTFELDVYWAASAGASILDLFRTYPGRFELLHLKDLTRDAAGQPQFADLGRGGLDLARILAHTGRAGVEYAFIEHDQPTPDGITSACASFDHLRTVHPVPGNRPAALHHAAGLHPHPPMATGLHPHPPM